MTPFAQLALQKQAGFNPAKLISRGMGWAGNKLSSKGVAAGRDALAKTTEKLNLGRFGPQNDAQRKLLAAASNKGQLTAKTGRGLTNGAGAIDASKGIQNAINIGGGTAVAGAGLYGANRMGRASGIDEGIGLGLDEGMTAGVEAAQANMAQQPQPGYLGGLMNAVQGNSGGPSINIGQTYGELGNKRQAYINQLMGRN